MNKLNKQCYLFKCKVLVFHCSTYHPVCSNICPICQKASEWPVQRMMLAAVQATDKRLIVLRYLMQISAHLAFFSSAQKDDSYWGPSLDCRSGVACPFAHRKRTTARCSLRDGFNGSVAIFSVYKWRHSDVIVIKFTGNTQN